MSLRQLLRVIVARYKLAMFVFLLTAGATIVISMQLPKQYTASASLVVDISNRDPLAAMLMPGSMGTQMDIIRSDRVAQKVVKLLKLDDNPAVQQQWRDATGGRGLIEQWLGVLILKNLSVSPGRGDSNIINVEYKAGDPGFAAAVANAFAQAYVDATIELKVDPAKQYARWFSEQGKTLRENLEKAQARLSNYQQEKGIVANDERYDTETAKFAALTTQLLAIQEQTVDARSKQRSGSGAETLPEVLGNSVVAGLRAEIVRQEGRLKEAEVNLGANHPRIRRMRSELAELKSRLEAETRHVTRSFSATRSIGKEKEKELRAAIEAQKRKLLKLKSERDQLAVLQRDVDAAQRAYDAVTARYTQTSLESQATQANVSVLTPAVAPLAPSFPKPLRVMALVGILLGLGLGAGAAVGMEMLDNRIRSADDLAEMLQVPVLGVVRRAGRRRMLASQRQNPVLTLKQG